jgi:hypothetical protein
MGNSENRSSTMDRNSERAAHDGMSNLQDAFTWALYIKSGEFLAAAPNSALISKCLRPSDQEVIYAALISGDGLDRSSELQLLLSCLHKPESLNWPEYYDEEKCVVTIQESNPKIILNIWGWLNRGTVTAVADLKETMFENRGSTYITFGSSCSARGIRRYRFNMKYWDGKKLKINLQFAGESINWRFEEWTQRPAQENPPPTTTEVARVYEQFLPSLRISQNPPATTAEIARGYEQFLQGLKEDKENILGQTLTHRRPENRVPLSDLSDMYGAGFNETSPGDLSDEGSLGESLTDGPALGPTAGTGDFDIYESGSGNTSYGSGSSPSSPESDS